MKKTYNFFIESIKKVVSVKNKCNFFTENIKKMF